MLSKRFNVYRRASTIILAYIASTLLVMLWLAFNIHVTLRQNEEDAEERGQPARVSEFLKARLIQCVCVSLSL